MADPRRTFGPVVVVGLASAGLAAASASKTWVTAQQSVMGSGSSGAAMTTAFGEYGRSPLAAAFALVVLATWGVILVTRGRFRRLVAALGVVAALGFTVTTALAPSQLRDALQQQLTALTGAAANHSDLSLTRWWWAALASCGFMLVTTALALWWVRHWPEMGTKYDAPTGARGSAESEATTVPTENIDIWKALDEGRDPTA